MGTCFTQYKHPQYSRNSRRPTSYEYIYFMSQYEHIHIYLKQRWERCRLESFYRQWESSDGCDTTHIFNLPRRWHLIHWSDWLNPFPRKSPKTGTQNDCTLYIQEQCFRKSWLCFLNLTASFYYGILIIEALRLERPHKRMAFITIFNLPVIVL